MTFGYDEEDLKVLIKNFKIKDDIIEVNFLDNSRRNFPLSDENINRLLDQELKQAILRNNSLKDDLSLMKGLKRESLIASIGVAFVGLMAEASMLVFLGPHILELGCLAVAALVFKFTSNEYRVNKEELEELMKYNIYLTMYKDLDNSSDLFEGVMNHNQDLSINTLDNYSLEDLRKIRENLQGRSYVKSK